MCDCPIFLQCLLARIFFIQYTDCIVYNKQTLGIMGFCFMYPFRTGGLSFRFAGVFLRGLLGKREAAKYPKQNRRRI